MGILNLSRRDFWATTPLEFWALWEQRFGHITPKMNRADLDRLMTPKPKKGSK